MTNSAKSNLMRTLNNDLDKITLEDEVCYVNDTHSRFLFSVGHAYQYGNITREECEDFFNKGFNARIARNEQIWGRKVQPDAMKMMLDLDMKERARYIK